MLSDLAAACRLYRWALGRTIDDVAGETGIPFARLLLLETTGEGSLTLDQVDRLWGVVSPAHLPDRPIR